MTSFPLTIVTPEGLIFQGSAEQLTVRTTGGDASILARHTDYLAALGEGPAVVIAEGRRRTARCIGGMVSVKNGAVTLASTAFAWTEETDGGWAPR